MNMNQLLDSIYANESDDASLEKTAEQAFMGAIDTNKNNPYEDMPLDELLKLAQDMQEDAPQVDTPSDEDLQKTAAAAFGGQIMAHSVIHELGLIKEAVANGICRVCKQTEMDIEGSSVCSACLSEEG